MQQMPELEAWQLLQPGQAININVDLPLFHGQYKAVVLDKDQDGVKVTVPVDQGKLVLLPASTPILVQVYTAEGAHEFKAWISQRHAGQDRYLVITTIERQKVMVKQLDTPEKRIPVWTVTSGKGGVGKTATVVNIALALIEQGKRVCVIDGDLGTANVDIVLNLAPRYTLNDVVNGKKHILETLVEGPKGLVVLPGGSGLQELTQLCDSDFEHLLHQFRALEEYTDIILIDTSSGLSRSVTNFVIAADQAILVTTPEPPAITDAYALIKVLARAGHKVPMRLVINKVRSASEAKDITEKIVFAARRFLNYDLVPLGYVNEDEMVVRAVREQVAVVDSYPKSRSAGDFRELAAALCRGEVALQQDVNHAGALSFLKRFRSLLLGRDRVDSAS